MAGPPGCDPSCACSGNEFGEAAARRSLRSYRRSGPPGTTAWLIDGLRAGGIEGMTVLDIGAGVGAVHLELLASGATAATDVDGSPAFVAVARERSRSGGAWRIGSGMRSATSWPSPRTIEPADIVVLDRVVCCYPDMEALVRLSVAHSRRRYGLVYPRDLWWIRAGSRIMNAFARLARQQVRAHVHSTAAVDAIVRAAGFAPLFRRTNTFWQVVVYERAA